MIRYVVGFCFTPNCLQVALILREKTSPESAWQLGKMNGLGGKIREGETAHQAMAREFYEEAGVWIAAERWQYRGFYFRRGVWSVSVFTICDPAAYLARTCSQEGKVQLVGITHLHYLPTVATVQWLVPLLLYKDLHQFEMEEV